MDSQVSKCLPRFSLLCVALLLCLGSGVFGTIDPGRLRTIIDYITAYGVTGGYCVVVRLDNKYCSDPNQNLEDALPRSDMVQMNAAISKRNGQYVPQHIGNIVAARPSHEPHMAKHAEWRLLSGGQNSPVAQLLANKDQNSCLILFSRDSPCVKKCLLENGPFNIVTMVKEYFEKINENSKAFVFESIYAMDATQPANDVVRAWRRIENVPLFRCHSDNHDCTQCFNNNNQQDGTSPCFGDQ